MFKANTSGRSRVIKTIHNSNDDITTGVMTWSPMDTEDIRVENESKWRATEGGLRAVESGLGGDEEGVFWVDEGSRRYHSS